LRNQSYIDLLKAECYWYCNAWFLYSLHMLKDPASRFIFEEIVIKSKHLL
jgi:hypothetical protein